MLRIQVASENGFYFQLLDWCNGGSARCLGRAVPFHVTETVSTSASVSGFGCQWFMRSYVIVHPDIGNSISRVLAIQDVSLYQGAPHGPVNRLPLSRTNRWRIADARAPEVTCASCQLCVYRYTATCKYDHVPA